MENFIDNNPEQIVRDIVLKMEEKLGYSLGDADVERILCDVLSYRESLLRAQIERLMRQNFVQTAIGSGLDYLGEMFGVVRQDADTEDSYRVAILNNSNRSSLGTRSAYLSAVKRHLLVSDALLLTKQDDVTLPPGVIKFILIEKKQTIEGDIYGGVASDAVKSEVAAILSDKSLAIVGDQFVFEDAAPVSIDGVVRVRKNIGKTTQECFDATNRAVDLYFNAISKTLATGFGVNDLERSLSNVSEISEIVNLEFPNAPIIRSRQFGIRGNVTIQIQ